MAPISVVVITVAVVMMFLQVHQSLHIVSEVIIDTTTNNPFTTDSRSEIFLWWARAKSVTSIPVLDWVFNF